MRDDSSTSEIYYQTSDTTWQAYNNFGGESLYSGGPLPDPDRAAAVSYNRPFVTRNVDGGQDWIFNAEVPMIRWLERNGYDVSYESGVDTDRYGSLIKNHRLFMSTGHDEYWSGQQRANVTSARDAGVNLAFFSGNEVFWKTRWDASHRTMICYKETHGPYPGNDHPEIWTGSWRDPNTTQAGVRPENELTGQYFTVNDGTERDHRPGQVPQPAVLAQHRRGEPVGRRVADPRRRDARLRVGLRLRGGAAAGRRPAASRPFVQPAGLTELSETTNVGGLSTIQDYGHLYAGSSNVSHHLTLYRAPSGALVFGAGTVQWSWGLDAYHDRSPDPAADPNMQQATVNLFSDMGAEPTSLQSGLQPG